MDEIVNRVKESGLISMDLATFKPKAEIVSIDVADVLWQRLVLKEKDFRSWITSHDWTVYKNKAVYVHCSEDAIVPTWAYMLIGSQLGENTPDYIIGSKIDLEKRLIQKRIESEPLDAYIDAE
mgnify:FL=1